METKMSVRVCLRDQSPPSSLKNQVRKGEKHRQNDRSFGEDMFLEMWCSNKNEPTGEKKRKFRPYPSPSR